MRRDVPRIPCSLQIPTRGGAPATTMWASRRNQIGAKIVQAAASHLKNISDVHSFALVLNRFLSSLFRAVSHSPTYGHAFAKTAFSVWFIDVLEIRPSHIGRHSTGKERQ
jgi:hypothetical protein